MTSKMIKMVAIILMAIVTVSALSTGVFAEDAGGDKFNLGQFDNAGVAGGAGTSVTNIIGAIITIVQIIGTGVAIIMLIVLAIKYISAAPGDKADIKKHAVVYVVGAIVLFAATGILGIVKDFAQNNIKNSGTTTPAQ